MKLTKQILKDLGFEMILIDYWRKGNFGVSIIWEDGKEDFYFSKAGKNRIEGLEHLKRVYKEDTGEELLKPH